MKARQNRVSKCLAFTIHKAEEWIYVSHPLSRRSWLISLVIHALIVLTANSNSAILMTGHVTRSAFHPDGTQTLQRKSEFRSLFDGKGLLVTSILPGRETETYFISSGLQIGAVSSPSVVIQGDGSSTDTGSNSTMVVVSKGPLPRGSSTEIKMVALSYLTQEMCQGLEARGFLAPWGDDLDPGVQCCRLVGTFENEQPHLLGNAEIVWDSRRWNFYVSRRDPQRKKTETPNRADGDKLGRYLVEEWNIIGGYRMPKKWSIERYGVLGPVPYRLELAEFAVDTFLVVATNPSPGLVEVPPSATTYDYRSASSTNVELKVVYRLKNGMWLNENSDEFRQMVMGVIKDREAMLRSRWLGLDNSKSSNRPKTLVRTTIVFAMVSLGILFLLLGRRSIWARQGQSTTSKKPIT